MESRIITLSASKMIGKKTIMSIIDNKTRELWQSFMPSRASIENRVGNEFYSIEVYNDLSFFRNFDPTKPFEKWAAVQVSDAPTIPEGLEELIIPEGLYAVFNYKGRAMEAQKAYQYILGQWLPNSEYGIDDRPHFSKMGDKYKNDSPDSEEELWVPIKEKD